MNVNRLEKIGFRKIGEWKSSGVEKITLVTEQDLKIQNVIYAYIINGDVKYIGKTTNTLYNRFNGYKSPGHSQNTNKGVKYRIIDALKSGVSVEVYIFIDSGFLKYGEFQINLAEGLEKSIIDSLDKKECWNGLGNRDISADTDMINLDSNGFHTLEEMNEIENQKVIDRYNQVLGLRSKDFNNSAICKELNLSESELDNLSIQYQNIIGS